MSELIECSDHLMIITDSKSPSSHRHLAIHMILSLGNPMDWRIGDTKVNCRGIIIGPDVEHSEETTNEGCLVWLFPVTSPYAEAIRKIYLFGKDYAVLEEKIVERVITQYQNERKKQYSLEQLEIELLKTCRIKKEDGVRLYDSRVQQALDYLDTVERIDSTTLEQLSKLCFLSQSRFSHLFKEETSMTLHSYLALQKLKKALRYYKSGKNITESCMLAGFSSSSHCAATVKRMFGISIREFHKTLATK